MQSQTTTTTNCSIYGNTANCTSNTTDNGAQQQRAYEAGQQVGNALGVGIARAVYAHNQSKGIRKYCEAHPGQDYTWRRNRDGVITAQGHCSTEEDKQTIAANEFMAHHKDYKQGPANNQAMTAYIDTHKLDPREKKSYERAYDDLKKAGQLDLYAN
jgi:hypothetical protein